MVAGGGVQTSKVSAEEWPLIQPSQVNIAVPPVHTAESMLTPLGMHFNLLHLIMHIVILIYWW